MNRHGVIAMVAGILFATGPVVRLVASGDQQDLQGVWVQVSTGRDGEQVLRKDQRIVFSGNRFAQAIDDADPEEDDRVVWTRFRLDATRTPRRIDLEQSHLGKLIAQGIYRLEGDSLILCLGESRRPTTFAAEPGSGATLGVYRRAQERP